MHPCRPKHPQNSLLTPWQTDNDDTFLAKYCSDLTPPQPPPQPPLPQTHLKRKSMNLPHIQKRRAYSTCSQPKKSENHPPPAPVCHPFNTLHPSYEKIEKKKTERGVLQEVSVKNFIIEGGQDNLMRDKNGKKRESTYILKQKFAEFRRSMKAMGEQKEQVNIRVIRYDK